MIKRMGENDALVTGYMVGPAFHEIALRVCAHEIFEVVAVDVSPVEKRA